MGIHALIDGDILVYRACLAAETPIEWDESTWTLYADMELAQDVFEKMLRDILRELEATHYTIALSDTVSFRKDLLCTYKGNRKDKRPPMLRQQLKEYVIQKHSAYLRPRLEADDILGILATDERFCKGDKVVVTVDKDLKTIPCWMYDIDSGLQGLIPDGEADFNHLVQTLTGDIVDGYRGCPGMGPVKARKLLNTAWDKGENMWEAIVDEYVKHGYDEDYALTQARVARILRVEDYDFKKKQPILWTPKKR
jgi:DNA polymerase-1